MPPRLAVRHYLLAFRPVFPRFGPSVVMAKGGITLPFLETLRLIGQLALWGARRRRRRSARTSFPPQDRCSEFRRQISPGAIVQTLSCVGCRPLSGEFSGLSNCGPAGGDPHHRHPVEIPSSHPHDIPECHPRADRALQEQWWAAILASPTIGPSATDGAGFRRDGRRRSGIRSRQHRANLGRHGVELARTRPTFGRVRARVAKEWGQTGRLWGGRGRLETEARHIRPG